ncbi:hypothetical protein AX15_003753 [Amanita polypyramis BW_CC]|nr:hypothetical protein AX15_003753 [Amanita polypyramis BW_CC]
MGDELLDEDKTARLRLGDSAVLGRHAVVAASSENVAALQRVKSLAERNRQALDKLSSMVRLASPVPSSTSTRYSRTTTTSSVTSSVHSSSSQASSSRSPSSLSSTRSERARARTSLPLPVTPPTLQEQALSGSETERESTSSVYTNHANNSSPSLPHMTHSLSTISSSSSSSQELNNIYGMSHAHTSTRQPPTTNPTYQTPQHEHHHRHMSQQFSKIDARTNHHHISPLASASASTPHLPSSARVFQTPPPQAQPLVKTRSTGGPSVIGNTSINTSGPGSLSRRLTSASTSSGSGSSHAGNLANSTARSKEEDITSDSSPRGRRRGGSGSALIVQGLTHIQATNGEGGRNEGDMGRTRMRKNTNRERENDVAQAALAAVASSRSRNSFETRRRSALLRELQRDTDGVDRENHAVDPATPYRSNGSAGQLKSMDRDALASGSSLSRDRNRDMERAERQREREKRQAARGGSAESALASRGPASADVAEGKSMLNGVLKAVGLSPKRNRKLEREREREKKKFLVGSGDVFENARVGWSPEEERVNEFGERNARMRQRGRDRERETERELVGPAGLRSATSLSKSGYSSRSQSRARTGKARFSDEDDDNCNTREGGLMTTAPVGLRSYRHTYSTTREIERERDSIYLSLMKKEREREREWDKDMVTGRSMSSLSRYSTFSTPVHQNGSSSSVVSSALLQQDKCSSRKSSTKILFNHTGSTTGGDSERAVSRQSALAVVDRTEHTRLMLESLAMFEGYMSRMSSSDGSTLAPLHMSELVKAAQSVVSSAERLNGLLRAASKNAVEQEIDAEVADDVEAGESGRDGRGTGMYSARDMVQVWKGVHADYKEGVKASDELVRGVTGFLLGIGKVLRDVGTGASTGGYPACMTGAGSGNTHARSVSLNDEDIIKSTRDLSPTMSGGSSRSAGGAVGRKSMDIIRRGWEPSPSVTAAANAREEALRRLTGRPDGGSMARTSSSVIPREQIQDTRYEKPKAAAQEFMTPAPTRSSTSLSNRRLLMPREQREQEQEQRLSRLSLPEDLVGSTSQDTIIPYEPSPTPVPRVRNGADKKQSLPLLGIARPVSGLSSDSSRHGTPDQDHESPYESSTSIRGHERRKVSNTSIITVRGTSTYPAPLNPSGGGATTAVTTHTVSNAFPDATPISSVSSSILAKSVPTLAGLQLQYEERQRMGETKAVPIFDHTPSAPMSGSETERPLKRQTWGAKAGKGKPASNMNSANAIGGHGRVSLGRAADRSAASSLLPHMNSARKERKNVAELFPKI